MKGKTIVLFLLILLTGFGLIFFINKLMENNINNPVRANPIPKLEKFVKSNPENVEALLELALRYYGNEREYRKADDLLKKVLELEPKNKLAMHRRSIIMEEQGLFNEAIAQQKKILLVEPESPVPLHYISQLSLISDRKQALEYAKKAVEVNEKIPEEDENEQSKNERFITNWLNAVVAFENESENDPLGASLKMLDHLDANHRLQLELCNWALQQERNADKEKLVQLLEKKGKLAIYYDMQHEAIKAFEQMIQTDPNYLYGYILLGDRLAVGNNTKSLSVLNNQIQTVENSGPEKNIISAMLTKAKGQTRQAIKEMEDLLDKGKYKEILLYQLGRFHEELGENDAALKYFTDFNNVKYNNLDFEYWDAMRYDYYFRINKLNKK